MFPTAKFFQENETELFETEVYDNRFEMFESMRIYVERNGRPNNYLDNVKKLNEEREKVLLEEERKSKIEADKKASEKKHGGEEQRVALQKLAEERLGFVMEHMKEL